MFSVIISEKGGAERRETFDRTEINVGRVQGNDLMLPKGNVSKRHARLLFRDGRFIVTDLKSTNGTYVNGRKIAQATIVREGDKIYIGDFVLRIESGAGMGASQPSPSQPAPPLDEMPSDLQSAPPGPIEEPSNEIPQGALRPRVEQPPPQPAAPGRPAVAPRPLPPASAVLPVPAAIPAPPPIPRQIAPMPSPVAVPAVPFRIPEPLLPTAASAEAPAGTETPRPAPSAAPSPPAFRASGPPQEPPSSSQPSSNAEKALRAPAPRIEPKAGDHDAAAASPLPRASKTGADRHEVISHFPLEHDPDESLHFAVPAPPRVPSSPKPFGKTSPSAQAAPPRGAAIQPTAPGTPFTMGEPPKPPFPPQPQPVTTGEPPKPPAAVAEPHRSAGGPPPAPTLPVATAGPVAVPAPQARDGGPALPPAGGTVPPVERATSPSVGLAALGISPEAGLRPAPARRSTIDGGKSYELEARARSAGPTGPEMLARAPERAPAELARIAAQRAALFALLDRVHELVDLTPLAGGAPPDEALSAQIERALADAVHPGGRPGAPSDGSSIRDRGDVDLDALVVEARREICELGPLTPLFTDEDVTEMQVVRHDHVVAIHGDRHVPADLAFSSEAAVGRVVRRLCLSAGRPLTDGETFVERRLARGGRMFAILPRAGDSGHMVVVRKPQRADLSLEDLVRSGTISRAMAALLSQCVAARANILVTGAAGAGTTTLIGALAGAGSTDDRVVVLQEDDELIFNQPHTVSVLLGDRPEERARAVQAAARVHPDRLVVGAFAGAAAAEMVDVMGAGVDGVLAGAKAPTLRQAVLRLTADIAATRPGLSPEVAREWLASVFDLAIEVARLRDGRHRVLRLAELGVDGNRVAIRDIFTFAVERTATGGSLEGTFSPTGVVPGILDDLAARGIPVDPSMFRRHARGE